MDTSDNIDVSVLDRAKIDSQAGEQTNNLRIILTVVISIIIGCLITFSSSLFIDTFAPVIAVVLLVLLSLTSNFIILYTLKERRWSYVLLLATMPIIYSVIMTLILEKLQTNLAPMRELYDSFKSSNSQYSGLAVLVYYFVGALMALISLIMSAIWIGTKRKPSEATTVKAPKNRLINRIMPLVALVLLSIVIICLIN